MSRVVGFNSHHNTTTHHLHAPHEKNDSLPSLHSSPREKACVPASKVARRAFRRSWCSVVGEAEGVDEAEGVALGMRGMLIVDMVKGLALG